MIDWFNYRSKSELRHFCNNYIIPVYRSIFVMLMCLCGGNLSYLYTLNTEMQLKKISVFGSLNIIRPFKMLCSAFGQKRYSSFWFSRSKIISEVAFNGKLLFSHSLSQEREWTSRLVSEPLFRPQHKDNHAFYWKKKKKSGILEVFWWQILRERLW